MSARTGAGKTTIIHGLLAILAPIPVTMLVNNDVEGLRLLIGEKGAIVPDVTGKTLLDLNAV